MKELEKKVELIDIFNYFAPDAFVYKEDYEILKHKALNNGYSDYVPNGLKGCVHSYIICEEGQAVKYYNRILEILGIKEEE